MRTHAEPLPLDALDLAPGDAAERFDLARRLGHPGYLWPEVPPELWLACVREIERAVALRLREEDDVPRLRLPRPGRADAMGIAAFTSGTGPLLGYWIETGALRADPDTEALLRLHLAHGRLRAARLEEALVGVLGLLAARGIAATVVKGTHIGRTYFPDPGARPASDVDLVVPPEEVEAASAVLTSAGYRLANRQSRPFRCEWVPPDAPRDLRSLAVSHADNPFGIDIHDSLERNFYGVRIVRLEARTEPWPALHPAAAVLAPAENLAFLALHASEELHRLQLVRLAELVLVVRGDAAAGRLDWDRLAAVLRGARALRFAFPAFELAERLAPGTLDPGFHGLLRRAATGRMRRVVAELTPGTAQRLRGLPLEERLMWASGPAELGRRLAYLLWPRHSAGSLRPLRRIYAERLYRLLRGTVAVRTRSVDRDG